MATELSNALREVLRLGESLTVQPAESIPDFPTGILDVTRQPVEGLGAAEGQQVCTRFAHPQHLLPDLDAGHVLIPVVAHETEAVGRVAETAIVAIGRERLENFKHVSFSDLVRLSVVILVQGSPPICA